MMLDYFNAYCGENMEFLVKYNVNTHKLHVNFKRRIYIEII